MRSRSTIVRDITKNKNRIKSHLLFFGIELPEAFINPGTHWSKRFIEWLRSIEMTQDSGKTVLLQLISTLNNHKTSLLQTTRQVRELSKTDLYKENVGLLISIPGIGLITAMIILTELETIDRFSNVDKLCDFVGIVPSTNSSGEKDITGRITKRGHGTLRTAIIESAWTAARIDPALHQSYIQYCKRMDPNHAIVRIAKKLLSRINYVLKNKQPYVCSVVK
jgi:transposase